LLRRKVSEYILCCPSNVPQNVGMGFPVGEVNETVSKEHCPALSPPPWPIGPDRTVDVKSSLKHYF